jgi:Fe-S cluster assembly protein SufB
MQKPMPTWGGDLSVIDFQNIYYYAKASDKVEKNWDDVPENVKNTFDKLGIPEAEKKFLAGVGAQYESEVVYHSLREDLAKQGVLFLDTDAALIEHPELFKKYFGKIIPPEDNKFAALNSAVWSGGSFIYVPPGVKVDMPLQAYFRINAENIGQFERTLIIVDEGAEVHYIEGCMLLSILQNHYTLQL